MDQSTSTRSDPVVEREIPLALAARHPVNWRSFLLGMLGVIYISGAAPFNDFVLKNSLLIGGSLPIGIVLLTFLFMLCVNGPLAKFAPWLAFSTGEMAVAITMMLMACVMPTAGLMKHWPGAMMGPFFYGAQEPTYQKVFDMLRLPSAFWPKLDNTNRLDPMITQFYAQGGHPEGMRGWMHVARVWLDPTLVWGVFFVGIFTSIVGISFIISRQWIDNERLEFPIAQVQLSLIEMPEPGRWLNRTFSNPLFWIGLFSVLVIRSMAGLHLYFPRSVPVIPLDWDFGKLFADPPWSYMEGFVKSQVIYLIVAAMVYFVSSRISFSLWFTMIWIQVPIVLMGIRQVEWGNLQRGGIQLGALLAFSGMILWTGRHHYLRVMRWMIMPKDPQNDDGGPVRQSTAGWMAAIGAFVSIGWLLRFGTSIEGAIMLVGGLLMIWVVLANVVAQAGLLSANLLNGPREWFDRMTYFRNLHPATAPGFSAQHLADQFFAQIIGGMWAYSTDNLSVYATTSQKITRTATQRTGPRLMAAIVSAMMVAFLVSEVSSLFCYYSFNNTQDKAMEQPLNKEILEGQPKWTMAYSAGAITGGQPWKKGDKSQLPWTITGFTMTAILAFGQLRYSWWPLHPIGLLMVFSYSMRRVWFSIFLGWAIKALIVRFGGARVYQRARPLFMGVIIGEVIASGLFGVLSIILWKLGIEYNPLTFLPNTQF